MLLAVVFVLSVSDLSNEMASFTASHSIHEKSSITSIYYLGLGKKRRKLESLFLYLFNFLINIDTALSWSLYKPRKKSSGDY